MEGSTEAKKDIQIKDLQIQSNVSLSLYTTFKIGGYAKFFVEVFSVQELKQALKFSKEKSISFRVIGGGSNILASDDGFDGLVIKISIQGIAWDDENKDKNNNSVKVLVAAGEQWDSFVAQSVEQNLFGLENLSAIPGTVGGGPVQNIGAYGTEIQTTIFAVHTINAETLEEKIFTHDECLFEYRESFFKTNEGSKYIIVAVEFVLQKDGVLKTDYKDVAQYFLDKQITQPTLHDVREAIVSIRAKKFPDLTIYGTAGSFFKNPVITQAHFDELKKIYSDIPGYPQQTIGMVKVSTAWILDHVCSLKGFRVGNIGAYEMQPLVIVNYMSEKNLATKKDVDEFVELIIKKVFEKTNIKLEREVRTLE